MPRTTHAGMTAAAERLRRAVENATVILESGEEVHVTVSVGGAIARTVPDPETGKRLLEEADAALYRAKDNGRNRVDVAPRRR